MKTPNILDIQELRKVKILKDNTDKTHNDIRKIMETFLSKQTK